MPSRLKSFLRLLAIDVPLILLAAASAKPRRAFPTDTVVVPSATSAAAGPKRPASRPWPGLLKAAWQSLWHAIKKSDFGNIMRRSAAVSYYAALSLAPMLVIALGVAALVFDKARLRAGLMAEVQGLVGADGAELIASVLDRSDEPNKALIGTIIGFVMLLVGATAVFVELQDGLNAVWDIPRAKRRSLWMFIRTRLASVAMVVTLGFLLLVSLLVTAALSALTNAMNLGDLAVVGIVVHFLVSVLVTGLMFAALFKFLPDARVRWREVGVGAVITAVLFNLGQIGIGQYLGRTSVGSAYGAAGSLVIVLVWVYYSAAILFFGAETTQAYATLFGSGIARGRKAEEGGRARAAEVTES